VILVLGIFLLGSAAIAPSRLTEFFQQIGENYPEVELYVWVDENSPIWSRTRFAEIMAEVGLNRENLYRIFFDDEDRVELRAYTFSDPTDIGSTIYISEQPETITSPIED